MTNEKIELAKDALSKIANRFDTIDASDSFWAHIEDIGDVLHSIDKPVRLASGVEFNESDFGDFVEEKHEHE